MHYLKSASALLVCDHEIQKLQLSQKILYMYNY